MVKSTIIYIKSRLPTALISYQLKLGLTERPKRSREGGHGVVLSIVLGLEYHQAEVILEAGEHLFSFTDGVTEAFNVERKAFGEGRLA
jgi:hypothetical protein